MAWIDSVTLNRRLEPPGWMLSRRLEPPGRMLNRRLEPPVGMRKTAQGILRREQKWFACVPTLRLGLSACLVLTIGSVFFFFLRQGGGPGRAFGGGLGFAMVPSVSASEGVGVTAVVDRNQIGVGDVISFTISVEAKESVNVEEPKVGTLPGFEVINSSSGFETRSSFVNGRFITEQSRNFTYMLAAGKKGNLTIPAVSVTVDGKSYQTKPIQVAVSDARRVPPQARGRGGQPPPDEQMDDMEEIFQRMLQRHFGQGLPQGQGGGGGGFAQPPSNPNEAFFIQAEVDKAKAYVGEQVVANFYLLTRGQIRDIDTLSYPDLKGFWKEDLEMATRLNFENVVINGLAYQRALLVSYALFPIRAGKAVVDSYKAKCTVVTPSNFGFGRPYVFTKASRPIDLEILEIPQNRPANFTGAVGTFHVNAQFEPPTGTVNQPVTLRVRVDGQGNAKLIELPKLDLPPSFEFYDQKSQAKFMKDGNSYKEFEVLIIPRAPGVFKLPPVAISAFDPKSKKFVEVASQPLDLSVTGTATTPAPDQAQKTEKAGAVAGAGEKPDAESSSREPRLPLPAAEMGSTVLADTVELLLAVAACIGSLTFIAWYGWRRLRHKPKKVSLRLVLSRRLAKVREHAAGKDWRRVGVELTNTAYGILGELSEQGGANLELQRLLERTPPSLRNELSEPIQKLLSQCEVLSFAPESMMGELAESKKLDGLIRDFENVMSRAIELAEI